jgi:hypothetical protein
MIQMAVGTRPLLPLSGHLAVLGVRYGRLYGGAEDLLMGSRRLVRTAYKIKADNAFGFSMHILTE